MDAAFIYLAFSSDLGIVALTLPSVLVTEAQVDRQRGNLVGSNCVGVILLLVKCNFRTKVNMGADNEIMGKKVYETGVITLLHFKMLKMLNV